MISAVWWYSRLVPSTGHAAKTGMAHGLAGIAMALMRLHRLTQDSTYRQAALDLCNAENASADPLLGNTPWQIAAGDIRTWNAWCRGATGIGLARLDMFDACPVDSLRQDARAAVDTPVVRALADVDHPCCGTFGRVELLLAAASHITTTDLHAAAGQLAAAAYDRAGTALRFRGVGTGLLNPTFHQGASGIGFTLLRLNHANELPSVLSWRVRP